MSTVRHYVLQGSFDLLPDQWAKAMSEIRDVLVETAQNRAMITYSDLVSQVDAVTFNPHDQRLFAILGQLSVAEHEEGRPLLSVLASTSMAT